MRAIAVTSCAGRLIMYSAGTLSACALLAELHLRSFHGYIHLTDIFDARADHVAWQNGTYSGGCSGHDHVPGVKRVKAGRESNEITDIHNEIARIGFLTQLTV